MTDTENLELLQRIIRALDPEDDGPGYEDIVWRTSEKLKVYVVVNLNDVFAWACSDGEVITLDNIQILEDTINELKVIAASKITVPLNLETKDEFWKQHELSKKIIDYFFILWAARFRRVRPQLPYYKYFPEELIPLFDACGTEENQYGTSAYFEKCERLSKLNDNLESNSNRPNR